MNVKTGRNYKLPSEAEWEFAARGGTTNKGYNYSGSNDINSVALYSGNSGNRTHTVGMKQPNELGIHDMTGDVWEWCDDLWSKMFPYRVTRGGSWSNRSNLCRMSYHGHDFPDNRDDYTGFRIVLP